MRGQLPEPEEIEPGKSEVESGHLKVSDPSKSSESLNLDLNSNPAQMYRLIAESSSDGIFLATGFRLVYANPAFFRIIGEQKLEDKNLLELLEKEDAEKIFRDVQRALKGELTRASYELKLKRSDGRETYIDLSMSRVMFNGKPHALGIVKDITEKKKMEEQLRHYNELLRLTNSILRHDVTNNLNVISGCIELCERECVAVKAVKRCLDLIDEIRALESFTTSKKESLKNILERIAESYEIELEVEGECMVESFLGIIFDNLIRNSIHHGGATKVRVKVASLDDCV